VRVHGLPKVGKSSIIRSARSLDLPKGKADAGISARTWSKEGLFTNLVFRDTDVTEEMWQEWSRAPLNAKYMLGEQGRTVHLVIHARNVQVSWSLQMQSCPLPDTYLQLSGPAALITASRLLQEDDNSLVVIMLNKTDLSEKWLQAQSSKHLEETARYMIDAGIGADVMKTRLRWFAVSADNGNGIGDAFREIARELRREEPIQCVASESMDIDA
jgi:GTPase SAR1 family protein